MNLLIELLAFAVAIGVLVVVHEYGHYSVARLCGVKVLRFSIGFGKPLFQWVSPKTGTEWTIAALPLGGYVKMLDERETGAAPIPAELLPQAFNRQVGMAPVRDCRGRSGRELPAGHRAVRARVRHWRDRAGRRDRATRSRIRQRQ